LAGSHDSTLKELTTETADLFLLGSAAAALAALILILRANQTRRTSGESTLQGTVSDTSEAMEYGHAEPPIELLVAWVQLLKSDIMYAVNALNNRLNVIKHTVSEADSRNLGPDTKQALSRIKSESDRAAKITAGLLHRVHVLAPDTAPPILFEYDGSKLPPGHILLVESDDANRTVISEVFRRLGQEVTAVSNGYEAFSAMGRFEPDCIVCGVRMQYLDGRTLFEQVEQEKPHLASRFVFVTGDYTNPATIEFLENTGQPYVGKPYEMETLLGAVLAILKNRTGVGSKATA